MVEKKKMSKELYDHCNEKLGSFSERVVNLSKLIDEKQLAFSANVKDVEKNTLHRIEDC